MVYEWEWVCKAVRAGSPLRFNSVFILLQKSIPHYPKLLWDPNELIPVLITRRVPPPPGKGQIPSESGANLKVRKTRQ